MKSKNQKTKKPNPIFVMIFRIPPHKSALEILVSCCVFYDKTLPQTKLDDDGELLLGKELGRARILDPAYKASESWKRGYY